MIKVIKSGKLDNVIASMDAGKHYIVKMRDGTVTAIEKTGLPEKIGMCLGNGCFIAGTLVTTKSGLKPIEEIKIGDYVLSRNEETGETSYKKVIDTLVRSTQEICTIELENGNIKSTTGHLFMVKDKWWKAAVELIVGDILVTSDGKEQVVKSIKVEEKGYPVTTYNLSVEDNHTFFVGTEKVLTHNTIKLLKDCNYTKEVSESITEVLSNPYGLTPKDIPSVRNDEFNKFFNSLTSEELDNIWDDPKLRQTIEDRLRHPGGLHEWHLVSRTPQFKNWNITAEQIKDLRSLTKDVKFVNPKGIHGGRGSTTAHNELLKIIDSSTDYDMFIRRLNNWSNYRLEGGIDSLPKGLQLK